MNPQGSEPHALPFVVRLEPSIWTTNRHYMYELPVEQVAQLVACQSATIAVGQVSAPFNAEQLEALRDFATGLRAP